MSDDVTGYSWVLSRPWSVSESLTYQTCRRQHWHRYVDHTPPAQPRPARQIIGSAIHAGLQGAYMAVRDLPGTVTWGDTLATVASIPALNAFARYWDEHGAHVRDYERDDAERLLLELLATLLAPRPYAVLGVEHKFTLNEVWGTVNGVIDLALQTGPEQIHVRDWKLGKVPNDPRALENNLQLATYDRAARLLWPWVRTVTVGLFSITQRREVSGRLHPDSVTFGADVLAHNALGAHDERDPAPMPGEHCATCRFRSYCPITRNTRLPVVAGVDVRAIQHQVDQRLP